MNNKCAFSGHRYLRGLDFDSSLLDRVILNLIKCGIDEFYCGMAVGFDLAAAESVLYYKKDYSVKLIACLPYADQSEKFSQSNKQRYNSVLSRCDEIVTLSPSYFTGCMLARDRFMVDNCDTLVCFLRKSRGGTHYTVNYAKKLEKRIIEL